MELEVLLVLVGSCLAAGATSATFASGAGHAWLKQVTRCQRVAFPTNICTLCALLSGNGTRIYVNLAVAGPLSNVDLPLMTVANTVWIYSIIEFLINIFVFPLSISNITITSCRLLSSFAPRYLCSVLW